MNGKMRINLDLDEYEVISIIESLQKRLAYYENRSNEHFNKYSAAFDFITENNLQKKFIEFVKCSAEYKEEQQNILAYFYESGITYSDT